MPQVLCNYFFQKKGETYVTGNLKNKPFHFSCWMGWDDFTSAAFFIPFVILCLVITHDFLSLNVLL